MSRAADYRRAVLDAVEAKNDEDDAGASEVVTGIASALVLVVDANLAPGQNLREALMSLAKGLHEYGQGLRPEHYEGDA